VTLWRSLSIAALLACAPSARAQHAEPSGIRERKASESTSAQASYDQASAPYPARDFDSPPPRQKIAQRSFAILALAMPYDGFGFGVRALGPRIGLDLSAGFRPVLASYSTDASKFPELALISAYQLNAALYLGLYRPNLRTDLGVSLGYKYNTLLGHGVGAAFYLKRELGRHFAFLLFVGPAVFPRAEHAIRKQTGWLAGSVSSGIAWHQGGLGVSLAYFP
jgi:hypothetical protein